VNWDYALIERVRPDDLTTSLVPFNLGKAIIQGDPQHDLLLQPGDVITIFSKEDLQVPAQRQTKYIKLEGEFASPGVYQVQSGETLRQLVVRVGGLASTAYLFGAEFTRESTRVQQQKNLTEAINRLEQDVQRASVSRAQNIVSVEDASNLKQQADSQQALIGKLRQIRPTGRIVIEVPETGQMKDLPDLPLEDGDRFLVPSTPSMVNVFGSVYSENSFIYKPEKRVADYLTQAGGPTRFADQGSIYVLRADGSVISKRQSGVLLGSIDGLKLMPGDSVVVPEELDRTTTTRMLRDISQIFYQFGLGAAAIRVLRN
jgi:protein involved in polysaccharide export with SLBB domain